ncbi:YqzL family protein [Paenibacillus sp. NPDC056579]
MRDFSWKYFSMTGNVDAYLLYKEIPFDEHSSDVELKEESSPDDADGLQ